MATYKYHLLDVFTDKAFGGNQLAVFTDGASVPPELMQHIAKELNLSESTFVMPPTNPANNFKVRIFTPGSELPMAGHPTVGTGYLLARLGMIQREGNPTQAVFEEGVGDIPIEISYSAESGEPVEVWMTQPKPQFGPIVEDRDLVLKALSITEDAIDSRYPVQMMSTGVPFIYVPLKSLADARKLSLNAEPAKELAARYNANGIFVFTQEVETASSTVHSRMFAPGLGVSEDPATGSACGPLGAYLVHYGIVPSVDTYMISEQGIEMGRPSSIHIRMVGENGEITAARIGGTCQYMGRGELDL
jgi:trans-2,3-dihydro-3-hydroxyanthranilate isomerase